MSPVRVSYWAEGPTDRAAARKLIQVAGAEPGDDYSVRRGAASGKDFLDRRLRAYNAAAKWNPWLVLRDSDGECAKLLVARLLDEPAPLMRFRVVVPSIEAWLLADRDEFAQFAGVARGSMPEAPEHLKDAKATLIAIVRRSSKTRDSGCNASRAGVGPARRPRICRQAYRVHQRSLVTPPGGWECAEPAARDSPIVGADLISPRKACLRRRAAPRAAESRPSCRVDH